MCYSYSDTRPRFLLPPCFPTGGGGPATPPREIRSWFSSEHQISCSSLLVGRHGVFTTTTPLDDGGGFGADSARRRTSWSHAAASLALGCSRCFFSSCSSGGSPSLTRSYFLKDFLTFAPSLITSLRRSVGVMLDSCCFNEWSWRLYL